MAMGATTERLTPSCRRRRNVDDDSGDLFLSEKHTHTMEWCAVADGMSGTYTEWHGSQRERLEYVNVPASVRTPRYSTK